MRCGLRAPRRLQLTLPGIRNSNYNRAATSGGSAMSYGSGRTFNDADSHLMELGDWLAPYADPDIREKLRPLYLGAAGRLADDAVAAAAARRGDAEAAKQLEANLMSAKGWSALGAFDRDERSRAL